MDLALFKAFEYSMKIKMVLLFSFYAYIFQDLNMAFFSISQSKEKTINAKYCI